MPCSSATSGGPTCCPRSATEAGELGRMLYDSVQHTLMALPDEVRVFPAHGAGSACGKNLSTERQSTIGAQRLTNYACAPMGEDEFVALVTEGQPPAPGYFVFDAVLNRKRHDLLDVESSARPLPGRGVPGPPRPRRGRHRRARPARVRRRPPARLAQRAGRRPVRRTRRDGDRARQRDPRDRAARRGAGGHHQARPDRVRHGDRLPERRPRPRSSPSPARWTRRAA